LDHGRRRHLLGPVSLRHGARPLVDLRVGLGGRQPALGLERRPPERPRLLVERLVGLKAAQRLVGQDNEQCAQVGLGAGRDERRLEVVPLLEPLGLDRRIGTEHQGARAATAGDLEAQHRLAGTGRQHQVAAGAARGPLALERLHGQALVAPRGPAAGHRGEARGELGRQQAQPRRQR